MPSQVLQTSRNAMDKEHPRRMETWTSRSSTENDVYRNELEETNDKNIMNVRSTNSPPPLISNSEYLVDKNESNLSAGNNGSSAFMMQFMTAAAAAAMAAASKKSEIQESKRDTYSNSNAYDNVSSTGRRCSSSFSSRQNASPSSTTSSSRSLLGVDGTRSSSISLKQLIFNSDKHEEDEEINIVRGAQNNSTGRRPGCSLPLPPGAVPIGTLPHPSNNSPIPPISYGLFTQFQKIVPLETKIEQSYKLNSLFELFIIFCYI